MILPSSIGTPGVNFLSPSFFGIFSVVGTAVIVLLMAFLLVNHKKLR